MEQKKTQLGPRLRVGVLMGGPSAEHNVSLRSGRMLLGALNAERYEVVCVTISKRGRWSMPLRELLRRVDVVVTAAMHGEFGEDGRLQKLLESRGVNFTGSGSVASKLGMDKIESATIFVAAGLQVPEHIRTKNGIIPRNRFGFPVVVKPSDRGSSIGVSIAQNNRQLDAALRRAWHVSRNVIVQRYVKGRELTCAVLMYKGRLRALPPTEIRPATSSFFDYRAKYLVGGSVEITPAPVSSSLTKRVQKAAITAHRAIGASGYSRTDMILDESGALWILEINTLPGMTKTSLVPQAAEAAGIPFRILVESIIESALGKR